MEQQPRPKAAAQRRERNRQHGQLKEKLLPRRNRPHFKNASSRSEVRSAQRGSNNASAIAASIFKAVNTSPSCCARRNLDQSSVVVGQNCESRIAFLAPPRKKRVECIDPKSQFLMITWQLGSCMTISKSEARNELPAGNSSATKFNQPETAYRSSWRKFYRLQQLGCRCAHSYTGSKRQMGMGLRATTAEVPPIHLPTSVAHHQRPPVLHRPKCPTRKRHKLSSWGPKLCLFIGQFVAIRNH